MRKQYTGIRLDKPNPVTGAQTYWLPHLRVRPGKGHAFLRSPVLALVDTGSPYCLFHADIAAAIGIRDITTGIPYELGCVKKGVKDLAYFHKIKLQIESEWNIDVVVGFSSGLSIRALLGRHGFFDHFLVTFDHSGNPPAIEVTKIDKPN